MSLAMILLILLVIALLGGFSGRFGGYGYGFGHAGTGVLGTYPDHRGHPDAAWPHLTATSLRWDVMAEAALSDPCKTDRTGRNWPVGYSRRTRRTRPET